MTRFTWTLIATYLLVGWQAAPRWYLPLTLHHYGSERTYSEGTLLELYGACSIGRESRGPDGPGWFWGCHD